MINETKTLRLRQNLRFEIDQIAKRSRRSFSEVAQGLMDEALRMRKSPGVYFADEPAGREAKIAGTGLAIWEVVNVYKAVSKDERLLQTQFPSLTKAQIKAALLYYYNYSDEIEMLIDDNKMLAIEIPKLALSMRCPKA